VLSRIQVWCHLSNSLMDMVLLWYLSVDHLIWLAECRSLTVDTPLFYFSTKCQYLFTSPSSVLTPPVASIVWQFLGAVKNPSVMSFNLSNSLMDMVLLWYLSVDHLIWLAEWWWYSLVLFLYKPSVSVYFSFIRTESSCSFNCLTTMMQSSL